MAACGAIGADGDVRPATMAATPSEQPAAIAIRKGGWLASLR
jgi:hypothetical protein